MGTESQIGEIEQSLEFHRTFELGEPSETSSKSRRKDPKVARYVRRHHAPEQIIGD